LKLILGRNTLAYFGIFCCIGDEEETSFIELALLVVRWPFLPVTQESLEKKIYPCQKFEKPKINQESVL
jgi:hypothetical protein